MLAALTSKIIAAGRVGRPAVMDLDQKSIRITQRASLHLEKIDGTWRVTYYTANQSEKPIQPAPSASPTT